MLTTTMDAHSVDPQVTGLMTVCGIRAAADLVEVSRDHRDHRAVRHARRMLYRLAQEVLRDVAHVDGQRRVERPLLR